MDTLHIIGFGIMATAIALGSSREHDICNWSTFNPTCEENEVIRMERAHFGRMSLGSCLKRNYGIGCQADVLAYLDSVCSARQSCKLRLPDEHLATGQPCLELESYLRIEYNCITVYKSPKQCDGKPLTVSSTSGLLANYITGRTGQGSVDCPWEIRGSHGQRIRLTLHDYGIWTPTKSKSGESEVQEDGTRLPEKSGVCQIYARITEGAITRSITLCGGETREQVVYISETDGVEIALSNPKDSEHPKFFLIYYEVIGCPKYKPPEGAVVEQKDNLITVTCTSTGKTWSLSCDGTQWKTEWEVTSCAMTGDPPISIGSLFKSALTLPQWILIVVIIAAAVIIAIPIVVFGILKFRRNHDDVILSPPNPLMDAEKTLLQQERSANEKSDKALQGREYTSTAGRHMAVRPETVPPFGGFRTLPLPRTASVSEDGNNTIHGTSRRSHCPREDLHATYKPPVTEDGYEMPNCLRHMHTMSDYKEPLYNELDPAHTDLQNGGRTDSVTHELVS